MLFSAVLRLLGVVETSYTENLSTGCYRIIYPSQPTRKMYAIDYSIGQYFFFWQSENTVLFFFLLYKIYRVLAKKKTKTFGIIFHSPIFHTSMLKTAVLVYKLHGVCSFDIKSIGAKFTYVVKKINLFTKKCI